MDRPHQVRPRDPTPRRLSLAETAERLSPMFRALKDAGIHGDAAVLRVTVAWWQARGLPTS